MLKLPALIVAVALFLAIGAGYGVAYSQQENPRPKQSEAQHQSANTNNPQTIPSTTSFAIINSPSYDLKAAADRNQTQHEYPWWVYSNFWIGVLNFFLVLSTVFLWSATRKTANIAKDSLVIGQGAFVFVEEFFFHWFWDDNDVDKIISYTFRPIWRNSGATQTKEMLTHVDFELRDTRLPPDFQFIDNTNQLFPSLIGPRTTIRGGTVRQFTIDELKAVKVGTKFLYLWGWARYYDIFPGTPRHLTRYCFQVTIGGNLENPGPKGEAAIISYLFHTRGTCADDECVTAGLS